ncbi:LacI family DNA-binding transcriptional regulator [Gulosibacter chungangensis]|uniref:LacI family transcriptional regulator n=1 Tax=Gulosibacter chungangensis TaxID=979746 RepID=A0A7J5BDN0_9MICO|nr:LacI family DNA-binding transcriptional regulator [Gulosibacter chungangensis]KAB1643398.1 LacI family transcriptional regulator [Gulosibacter chungangensis]
MSESERGDDGQAVAGTKRARPTMKDVADHVGLSRQLVSIVLRGVPGASEESRERILAAAQELGYYPDASAQRLRSSKNNLLGVLFTMRQPFEVDLVDALYQAAEERGYVLSLSHIGPGRSQQTALAELLRQRIDALIVLAAEGGAATTTSLPRGIPAVLVGGPSSAGKQVAEVRVDNAHGIGLAVDHLVELGHREITYVGPNEGPNAAERIAGFHEARTSNALPGDPDVIESEYTEDGGHLAAKELLARRQLPSAVVCGNDRCAFGLLETLVRSGIKVPEQVSIVGFDDSSVARLPFVDLTSVRPDPAKMAAIAVDSAHEQLQIQAPQELKTAANARVVKPSLTVRGSTAVNHNSR